MRTVEETLTVTVTVTLTLTSGEGERGSAHLLGALFELAVLEERLEVTYQRLHVPRHHLQQTV
jgi:hypothetical protein